MGILQNAPTLTHEYNATTISYVLSNWFTPQIKHINTLIYILNKQYSRQCINPITTAAKTEKEGMNTKPYGRPTL